MSELVEVHSGYRYGERPLALHWEGQRLEVEAVIAAWRTPHGLQFRVRTADQRLFELTYQEANDQWEAQPL